MAQVTPTPSLGFGQIHHMPIPQMPHLGPSAPGTNSGLSHGGYSWLQTTSNGSRQLCPRGVVAGRDSSGSEMYVGRSMYQGEVIPAKVIPHKNTAYISHNGIEIAVQSFEMLVRNECSWVQCSNGQVPPGAFPVGYTNTGEVLYAGRVHSHGAITLGKVHPSHGCCYIPYGGKEESSKMYEVLVLTSN